MYRIKKLSANVLLTVGMKKIYKQQKLYIRKYHSSPFSEANEILCIIDFERVGDNTWLVLDKCAIYYIKQCK